MTDPYLDGRGVLKNLLGIADAERLQQAEADFTKRVATGIKFKSRDSSLQYIALLELIDFEDCVNLESNSKNERI